MNLKDLRYRINDENGLSIIGYDPESQRVFRDEDESEVNVTAYFVLKARQRFGGNKFEIGKSNQSWLLGGSGNSYSIYHNWGSKLHRDVFKFLFANEDNIIRKYNLWDY